MIKHSWSYLIKMGMIGINIAEFIEYWANRNKVSKSEAERQIKLFESTLKSAVVENGKLDIRGFFTAEVVTREARECLNPRNQKKIKTPAKRVVKLKISPKFRNILKESP